MFSRISAQATCLTTVAREMENKYEAAHLWTDTTDMSCPDQVSSSMWKVTTMTASTAVVQNSSPTAKLVFRVHGSLLSNICCFKLGVDSKEIFINFDNTL